MKNHMAGSRQVGHSKVMVLQVPGVSNTLTHMRTCSEAALYLVVEPQVGRLKRGRCKVRRERDIPHPGERSQAGRSQAEAGRMERPLECAGLHSSSVHH